MVTENAAWYSLVCKLHEGRDCVRGLLCPALAPSVGAPRMYHLVMFLSFFFFEVCVSCVQKSPIGWLMFDVVLFVSVLMACFQH